MKKRNDSVFTTYKKQIDDAVKDLKTKGRRHRQIPNILTLMRLTAPCFIIPTAFFGNIPLLLGLTALFSITDFADGFIARKWHLTSELGETLDAVTDKVFASTLLLAASVSNPILLCNLALEGAIAGINTYKKLNDKPVKSSFVGKVKTWFLFSLVGVGIISPYFDITNILNTLMISTVAMQVFTICSYLPKTSMNQELEIISLEENDCLAISDNSSYVQKELSKDKILEVDTTDSKKQDKDNDSLKRLKEMRELLLSEQVILESDEDTVTDSANYGKSKADDFKKNYKSFF